MANETGTFTQFSSGIASLACCRIRVNGIGDLLTVCSHSRATPEASKGQFGALTLQASLRECENRPRDAQMP